MQRHVQHPGVVVEGVLGAVAVVGVPVDDQDPLAAAARAAAVTATLLRMQKPMARPGVA